MATNPAYVGPYSLEAYNAAKMMANGGTGAPYNGSIVQAGQAILDAQSGGAANNGGSASGGTPAVDNSYWNAQNSAIDDQLGRLGTQENIGRGNISSSYNAALNTLMNQKASDQNTYNTTKTRSMEDNETAKSNIATGVRTGLTSLQRLLGSHGAGNSSAAGILAPYAAGRMGSQQQSQVQNAYGRNMQDLDTGWNSTLHQYDDKIGSLGVEKTNKENSLLSNLANIRAQLLGQKQQVASSLGRAADPAIAGQIRSLGDQVVNLGAVQTFDPGHVDYKTPDLQSYNYDNPGAPSNTGQDGGIASNLGPFWSLFNDKRKATLG